MSNHLQKIKNDTLADEVQLLSERLRHILSQDAAAEDQTKMIGDYLFAIEFATRWLEQNHRKVALYEKLRCMVPRQFAAVYAKNMHGEGDFDDLVARWPDINGIDDAVAGLKD